MTAVNDIHSHGFKMTRFAAIRFFAAPANESAELFASSGRSDRQAN
jgi:hypothetical protein